MTVGDVSELEEAAVRAIREKDHARALECYLRLEELQPRKGHWSQRVAETCGSLGQKQDEIGAWGRAVERFANSGELLQAIASGKQLLLRDPGNMGALEQLAELYAARDSTPGRETAAPMNTPPGTPLDQIDLSQAVSDSRPAEFEDMDAPRSMEIPLQQDVSERRVTRDPTVAQNVLPKVPLFCDLDRDSLRHLIEGSSLITLSTGETVFREGDSGDALYVVVDGAVVPVAESVPNQRLAVLEPGDFFGEIALVTDCTRTATVNAIVDTQLLVIDRSLVAQLVERDPSVLKVMLRYVRDRLTQKLLRTSPLFASFAPAEREVVAECFRFIEAKDGAELTQQGRAPWGLFVLLAGKVDVVVAADDGDKTLASLEVGDFFAEMSMLTGSDAMATCVARGKCWLIALSRDDIQGLMRKDDRVLRAVEEVAARRNLENQRQLGPSDGHLELL